VQLVFSPLCTEFYQLTLFHSGVNAERIRIWLLLPVCWHDHNFKTTRHYGDSNSTFGIRSNSLRAGRFGVEPLYGEEDFLFSIPTQPPINRYRRCSPTEKRPGLGADHPTPFSAEVRERVQLYLYSPLCGCMSR
jgi:hypothetical protein